MSYLQRGQILLSQNRYKQAEKEFSLALQDDPQNAFAHALMAECKIQQRAYPEALEFSSNALKYEPDNSLVIYIHGHCLFLNNKIKEAEAQIRNGLQKDPREPDFFFLLGQIAFHKENWKETLEHAEAGLAIDPEDIHLINLRARALIQLNRREEAEETMSFALKQNPESGYSHANKGWVHVQQGKMDEAIDSFKEALRFEPDNEFAKNGLKEAIKGKNPVYRMVLNYFLWMNRMSRQNRWVFIIGIYIIYRIILEVADTYPSLGLFLYPFIFLYVILAFSSWIAMPVSNFALRFHPIGKYALDKSEIIASNIVGAMILSAIIVLSVFYVTGIDFYLYLGGFIAIMLIPVGATVSAPDKGKTRQYLQIYTGVLALIGIIGLILPWMLDPLILVFVLGVFLFSWFANYLLSRDEAKFIG